ncbi:MAG: hypothetical protein ABIJ31_07735 [Pseudomonadota bacterium]
MIFAIKALFPAVLVLICLTIPAPAMEGLNLGFKATALAGINGLADSDLNPGNSLARLPDKESLLLLKLDLSIVCEDWLVFVKPRAEFSLNHYEIQGISGENTDGNADIPEFMIRRGLTNDLFVSYGRENLQWGPSFLYSPSNPFFSDNEKKSLVQNPEGKGLLKMVMVHDEAFSASLIYNTDKGAFNESGFEKTLALKLDYSGDAGYGSLILSHRDHGPERLGAFAGATLTDAVLVYGEGSLQNEGGLFGSLLLGATYTLESGDSLCLEYLYYEQGQGRNPDFLRENYILVQFLKDDLMGGIDLVSRVTLCLDNGSSRLYSALSRELGNHMELKTAAMINTSGALGVFLDYQIQVALEYTY